MGRSSISRSLKATSTRSSGRGSSSRYRDFFTAYAAKITARRPANIRTIERYLLLAGDLPGLKFKTSLRPSETARGAATLVVEVAEKRIDANAQIDNRGTQARGPFEYLRIGNAQQSVRSARGADVHLCGRRAAERTQLRGARLQKVLTSEGLTFFADASDAWGTPGTVPLEIAALSNAWAIRRRRLVVSGASGRAKRTSRCRACYTAATTRATRSARRSPTIVCAAFAARSTPISPTSGMASISSTSHSARASRAWAAPATATRWPRGWQVASITTRSKRPRPAIRPCSTSSRPMSRSTASMPARRCLLPEQCGFGGRYFGRAFDPSQLLGDSCFESGRRVALRPAGQAAALRQYGAALRLYRLRRPLHTRRRPRHTAGSAGGVGRRRCQTRLVRPCRRRPLGCESD